MQDILQAISADVRYSVTQIPHIKKCRTQLRKSPKSIEKRRKQIHQCTPRCIVRRQPNPVHREPAHHNAPPIQFRQPRQSNPVHREPTHETVNRETDTPKPRQHNSPANPPKCRKGTPSCVGATPMFPVENGDDTDFLCDLITAMYEELQAPKAKKKTGKGK